MPTLDLIHEEGLQSVTFSKIFKRADVGSGTIYNYFANKEELVNAVYKKARMLMGEYMLQGYDPEASLYERFKCLQLNRLKLRHSLSEGISVYRQLFLLAVHITRAPQRWTIPEIPVEVVLSLIVEGQKQGLFKEMDTHLCHQFIHGIMTSILKGYYVRKYPLNESQTQQDLESSWKALLV